MEENDDITPHGREQLTESLQHLEVAVGAPGWDTWMKNSISLPFDVPYLPAAIRQAWSDNAGDENDPIDTASLIEMRKSNLAGNTQENIFAAGAELKAVQAQTLLDMEERETRGRARDHNKPTQGNRAPEATAAKHETVSTAKAPPTLLRSPKRRGQIPKQVRPADVIDVRLDEAARNAELAALSVTDDCSRPLPDQVQGISRSAKLNFVLQELLTADAMDKFVIFGDTSELGHMTEALDLFEMKSLVTT